MAADSVEMTHVRLCGEINSWCVYIYNNKHDNKYKTIPWSELSRGIDIGWCTGSHTHRAQYAPPPHTHTDQRWAAG